MRRCCICANAKKVLNYTCNFQSNIIQKKSVFFILFIYLFSISSLTNSCTFLDKGNANVILWIQHLELRWEFIRKKERKHAFNQEKKISPKKKSKFKYISFFFYKFPPLCVKVLCNVFFFHFYYSHLVCNSFFFWQVSPPPTF